jgi:hypothetical protein
MPQDTQRVAAASGDAAPAVGPSHASAAIAKSPVAAGAGAERTAANGPPRPAVKHRSAAVILSELARLERMAKRPGSGSSDTGAQATRQSAELIGELDLADPENKRLPALIIERWLTLRDDAASVQEREKAMALPRGDAICE